jgi:Zn-dependent protease
MEAIVRWPPTWSTLLLLPALFIGFTVHELAHAVVAFLLGDTSQVERKRLSFNPLRHVSWIGLIVFLLFRFGWAKPVLVDSTRLRIRNRPFGLFLVSISGAVANLLAGLAAFAGMLVTVTAVWMLTGISPMEVWNSLALVEPGPDAQGLAIALSSYMVMVNLILAFFNLLPIPPLDGFQATISLIAAIRIAMRRTAGTEPARPMGAPAEGEEAPPRAPAQIHFDIGLDYHQAGQLDEALARYRQAADLDEGFTLAYYNLGLVYWAKGRAALATSAFKAAAQWRGDPAVRVQAELRLRELAQLKPEAEVDPAAVPPPLDPRAGPGLAVAEPVPLDPAVVRRVWLSLAAGAVGFVFLALAAWLYVTVVAFSLAGGTPLP